MHGFKEEEKNKLNSSIEEEVLLSLLNMTIQIESSVEKWSFSEENELKNNKILIISFAPFAEF